MFSSLQDLMRAALASFPGGRARRELLEQQAQLEAELKRIRDMHAEFVLATMRLKQLILSQPNGPEAVGQLMRESVLLAEIWADEAETRSPSAANDR